MLPGQWSTWATWRTVSLHGASTQRLSKQDSVTVFPVHTRSGGITLNCSLTVVAWRGHNSSSSPQMAYLLARLGFTLGTMDRTLGVLEYQGGALSPSSYCLFEFFSIRFSSEVGPGEALS